MTYYINKYTGNIYTAHYILSRCMGSYDDFGVTYLELGTEQANKLLEKMYATVIKF